MEDSQLSEVLAALAIRYSVDNQASNFVAKNNFTVTDKDRFIFSLSILNTVLATIAANVSMSHINHTRKSAILDRMVSTFSKLLSDHVGLVDPRKLIASQKEISILEASPFRKANSLHCNIILDMLYDNRIDIYEKAIDDGLKKEQERRGGTLGIFSNVIYAFGDHTHGDDTAEDVLYITQLSQILYESLDGFMSICKKHK